MRICEILNFDFGFWRKVVPPKVDLGVAYCCIAGVFLFDEDALNEIAAGPKDKKKAQILLPC